MKKPSKKTLKNKADKIFSERIRSIGVCYFQGKDDIKCGGSLQCMHIIGRSNHTLRWDKDNALCGCAGHHRYYTSHPFDFYELLQTLMPARMFYLASMKNEIWDKDIEKVLQELER